MTTIDDHTPDTREARSMYCAGSNLYRETPEQHYLGAPAPDYGAEFDRFLARVRRDAAGEALDQAEARIEAVRDLCDDADKRHASVLIVTTIRRALDG